MATMIEKTGKTVEEALSEALDELGVAAENVEYEILENPSKGFFGFGAKPAKIQVTVKEISAETQNETPAKIETPASENFDSALNETPAEQVEQIENVQPVADAENKTVFDKAAVIANAQKFLSDVFAAMNMNVEVNPIESENEVVLDLVGEDLGILIGKHGQTLDALQYLTNLAANVHDSEDRIYFVLDVENYRKRRATALTKLAKSVAERAVRTKKDVRLEPMSRSERKVIHTTLQNNSKVETHSAGEDPYRYIIVSPVKKR